MINFQIRIVDVSGNNVAYIRNFLSCDYVLRGDGSIGALTLVVPRSEYATLFTPNNVDYRVQVWRAVNDRPFGLDGRTEFLITSWRITQQAITITAGDLQSVLARRVNAYPAATAETVYSAAYAGNIMKDLVRKNFIAPGSTRDGSTTGVDISAYLTVAADANDGLQMDIACSRNNVHDVVQKISYSSQDYGSWIIGRITSDGTDWTFDTYPNQFGSDRRALTLSVDSQNIENIELEYDRSEEYTALSVGGSGTSTSRIIGTADSPNITLSPVYRREYFYSNPQITTQNEADYYAQALTRQYRGQLRFTCTLISSPYFVRGVDYDLGDIITVQFLNLQYTTRIDMVRVNITPENIAESAELRLV